ncbi:Protein of unknown function [Selenomonas sp. GACV-9]|uniref:hypothetical protein n=1 Tax=Selenomonas sp. GACV-9 TaxID=3158782 RepID=UPI0008E5BE0C|nr:Protein of unknown function [Selenomonas ruminantium]
MKKYIVVLCMACLLAFSASALAATPDAAALSGEQETAVKWVDAMLVKQDAAAGIKLMGPQAQKNIQADKLGKSLSELNQKFGKYQESKFISWTRFDQADQMIYLMRFEKEQLVRCELIFDKKGQLENFSLAALKENTKEQKKDKK